MSAPAIRVLVVDDSMTVRKHICSILEEASEFELVGEAENGQEAVELCQRLRPDVVTMDMMMPHMTGLAATEQIMAHCPTPILVVSSSLNRGEVFHTYEALAAGAVDVLDKSHGQSDLEWERRLLSALRVVSKIRVITHPRGRLGSMGQRAGESQPWTAAPAVPRTSSLIALGASTGGPGAIADILRALPQGLKAPILLVLHISEPFGDNLASWLDTQSSYRVRYATDEERLEENSGAVVMAPPGQHMTLRQGRLHLDREAERHSCRPSVDVLFESLAREPAVAAQTVAALLTGMGKDGASGLLALRVAGALTIAQDEATCVVYGMPREAALLGAAERILPLARIPLALAEAVKRE